MKKLPLPSKESSLGLKQSGTKQAAHSDRLVSKAPPPITSLRWANTEPSRQPLPAKWEKWKYIPKCRIWEATCLTFDIEPDEEKHGMQSWLQFRRGVPIGFPEDFAGRLQIVLANIGTNGPIHSPMGATNNPHAQVFLSEVAFAAISWGWNIPDALRALATKVTPESEKVRQEKPLIELPHKSVFKPIDGLYMYQQAAREIADAESWDDSKLEAFKAEMASAINDGSLPIRSRKTGKVIAHDALNELKLVTVDDVNEWLKSEGVKFRWTLQTATQPQAAPGLSAGASDDVKPLGLNWRMQIQAEAYEHWIRLRASGCNPSVWSICDDLANWCVERNIKGGKGQNPKGGTIRNTVLGAGRWTPPYHSVEQAKKHIEQIARTAQTQVAQTKK